MISWITPIILLLTRGEIELALCQSSNIRDAQSFLNQFCFPGSNNPGCGNSAIIQPGQPLPPPIQPPAATPPPTGPSGCYADEKKCPQSPQLCIPRDIDCNVVGSGISCAIPRNYGVVTEELKCGDGSRFGSKCDVNSKVPVLTLIVVQCQAYKAINQRPIGKFGILSSPGGDGGAGVYRCSPQGQWQPMFNSPSLQALIVSCRDVDCGRVPQPSENMPIYRRWSWVRAIYKRGADQEFKLHCTGTLVSQNALVTAAHCITVSARVSNTPDPYKDNYLIELPGPNNANLNIKVQPTDFFIHPNYRANGGEYQHDMAVIFFNFRLQQTLPTVCISNEQHRGGLGKSHVVFSLQGERSTFPSFTQVPHWKAMQASWDNTCLTTTTRFSSRCIDTVEVQRSQFCAAHKDNTLESGSSGGPYLAEIGQDMQETWVLMGVLSKTAKIQGTSCSQDHSVYGQVADEFRWLKDCVFDKKCFF